MRTEIIIYKFNKDTDKHELQHTNLWYEKTGSEGIYDFEIFSSEDGDDYLATIRRFEEYDAETDASFWSDDADECIEGDEAYLKYSSYLE